MKCSANQWVTSTVRDRYLPRLHAGQAECSHLTEGRARLEGLDDLPLVTASLRPVWGLPSSGTCLRPQVTHQLGEALSFMMLAAQGHNLHQVPDSEAMGSGLGALGVGGGGPVSCAGLTVTNSGLSLREGSYRFPQATA